MQPCGFVSRLTATEYEEEAVALGSWTRTDQAPEPHSWQPQIGLDVPSQITAPVPSTNDQRAWPVSDTSSRSPTPTSDTR